MLQSGFLEVKQSLLVICDLLLNDTLSAKDVPFDFFKCLVLSTDLLSYQRRLMRQTNNVLILSALDDIVHSV